MIVIDTDIDRQILAKYYNKVSAHFSAQLEKGSPYMDFYPTRNIKLSKDDPIVGIVKDILESQLRVKLTLNMVELQTWPIGSESQPHRHTEDRDKCEDYNSLLYLNDDFEGGVFFGDGLALDPKPGRLTFFNGLTTTHGLTPVKKAHRHTIIFWWKDTKWKKSKNKDK